MPKGEMYRQGKWVVLLVAATRLVDLATGLNGEIITYSKYYRYATFLTIALAALTVVTNGIFIPLYSINGAAYAYAVSFLLFIGLKLGFVWVKFRLQPFTGKTLLCLLITAAVYGVVQLLPASGHSVATSLINTVIKSLVIAVLFGLLALWLNVSPELNQLLKSFYAETRKRLKRS